MFIIHADISHDSDNQGSTKQLKVQGGDTSVLCVDTVSAVHETVLERGTRGEPQPPFPVNGSVVVVVL